MSQRLLEAHSHLCSSLCSPGRKPCLIPADLGAADQSPEQEALNKVPREYLRCIFTFSHRALHHLPTSLHKFLTPIPSSKPSFSKKFSLRTFIFLLLLLHYINVACNPTLLRVLILWEEKKLFYVMLRARACVGRQTEGSITSQILNRFSLLLPVLHRAATNSLLLFSL